MQPRTTRPLDAVARHAPAVIVLDLMLPGLSVTKFARACARESRDAPS